MDLAGNADLVAGPPARRHSRRANKTLVEGIAHVAREMLAGRVGGQCGSRMVRHLRMDCESHEQFRAAEQAGLFSGVRYFEDPHLAETGKLNVSPANRH